MKLTSIAPLAIIIASPVFASNGEITAEFRESAPKDSFIISNTGGCAFTGSVTIDLAESAGKLLFDTTASGQGVEFFQPFELVKGKQFLTNSPKITDGDTKIMLRLNELAVGSKVSFTIDVDDTLENSALGQIRVSNS